MKSTTSMLLLWTTKLVLLFGACSCYTLEGSDSSYVEYPAWAPTSNASVDLQFSTSTPHGVLLYADEGGPGGTFYLVTLVGGSVRLRYNLGHLSGAKLISAG